MSGDQDIAGALVRLEGARLSESAGLRRRHTRPPTRRTDRYLSRYDDRTLIYDAFEDPSRGGAWLVAPRLLNLWKPLAYALSRSDKQIFKLNRHCRMRCEEIFIPGLKAGDTLRLPEEADQKTIRIEASHTKLFAGRNVLLAVNKNNPIRGVSEWLRYHAHHHGADAAILIDNASEHYSVEALFEQASSAIMGPVVVISAPFPYGPADKSGRFDVSPRFFQTAMLNIARLRFLQEARAVLSVDLDEMVCPVKGTTIFNEAVKSRLGLVSFRGDWLYSKENAYSSYLAHDNYHPGVERACNLKWCIRPQGWFSGASWQVHRFGGVLAHSAFRKDLSYWHFRQASTSWKSSRDENPEGLAPYPSLSEHLNAAGISERWTSPQTAVYRS